MTPTQREALLCALAVLMYGVLLFGLPLGKW